MRTLNKALCLVLALVMILGLGAFSVSADTTTETATEATAPAKTWSDADQIKYDEAANVLATLGVMEGRDDGTYDPQAELNRQEGAVMITRLLGQNPSAGSSTFLDIDNPFYQPYLAYIQSQEIIAGYGDGNFGPYDKLTGLAFAKMLLGTLGYKADVEGMVGTLWELGVLKLVRSTDLDKGLGDIDLSQPITREKAAHMLLNTIQTPMVRYDSTTNISVNGANVSIGGSEAKFLTTDSLAKQTIDGVRDTNNYNSKSYLIEFGEEYWKDLRLIDWGDTHDDFGRPTHKWSYKNAMIGTYKDAGDLIATYTAKLSTKQLYELVGSAAYDAVDGGRSGLTSYIDGIMTVFPVTIEDRDTGYEKVHSYDNIQVALTGELDDVDLDKYMHKTHTDAVNNSDNGVVTEVYLTGDNDIRLVTYHTWLFEVNNSYNGKNGSIMIGTTGDTNIRLDDARLLEADYPQIKDFKAGDKVLVTATYDADELTRSMVNSDGWPAWDSILFDVQDVELAQSVTGKVDSYRYKGTWNITLDGKTYDYSATTSQESGGIQMKRYATGQNATLILDKYGYVIGVDKALTTKDYVFIREFGSGSGLVVNSQAYGAAVFADGTTANIRVRSAYNYNYNESTYDEQVDTQNTLGNWGMITPVYEPSRASFIGDEKLLHAGQWYTYSKNSNNEYTLYSVEDDYVNFYGYATNTTNARKEVMHNESVYFFDDEYNGKRLRANDDTIVILEKEDGKFTTYNGIKNIPTITLAPSTTAWVYYTVDDDYVSLMYVKVDGDAGYRGGSSDSIIYVVDYLGVERSSGKDDVWRYKVLDENAQETEILADKEMSLRDSFPAAYGYAEITNGILTDFKPLNDSDADYDEGVVGGYYVDGTISHSAGVLAMTGTQILVDANGDVSVDTQAVNRFSTVSGAEIFLIATGDYAKGLNDGEDYTAYKCKNLEELANLVKAYDSMKFSFAAEYDGTNDYNYYTRVEKLYVTVDAAADSPLYVDFDLTDAKIVNGTNPDNGAIGLWSADTYVIHSDTATFWINVPSTSRLVTDDAAIFITATNGSSYTYPLHSGTNYVEIRKGNGGWVLVEETPAN